MASLALAVLGALALLSLGDLRAAPWPGVALLLLWGGAVVALRPPRGGPGNRQKREPRHRTGS
jgi:hypothetical protein